MNKLPLLLSLLILVLLTGCTSEEERRNSLKIDLKFTVRILQPASTAARTHTLPDGVKLLITVKSKSGKLTLTHYPLNLTRDGDQYISESFAVDPGRYVVDDFFVVNSSSLLLCATPKEKSSLASQVRATLPFSFTASKGKNTNLVMEVIPVAGTSPEEFGYTSFGIDVAQSFGIAVFESASGSRKLTGATLTLDQDSLEILNFPLEERLNNVPFEGNPEEQFVMVVSKEGFIPYRELTTYNELKEKEGSSGVEIDLTPLGEYLAVNDFVMGPIIGFNNPATITIFTPNGQATSDVAQDYDPDDFYSQTTWLALEYMETTDRTVYIKEDLEKINFLMISNATTLVTTYTPNLAEINIGGEFDALDFSNNTKLWQITFNGVVAESLIFPEEHEIRAVALYYNTSHVPYIIENIYRNAVRKNLHNGSMTLDDLNDDILQSFSPEVRAMLDDLRTNYGWAVYE